MDHPRWCVRRICTAERGGHHRSELHIVPAGGPPEFWWWLVQWDGPVTVALSSGGEPAYVPASGLAELARVIAELAALPVEDAVNP